VPATASLHPVRTKHLRSGMTSPVMQNGQAPKSDLAEPNYFGATFSRTALASLA